MYLASNLMGAVFVGFGVVELFVCLASAVVVFALAYLFIAKCLIKKK